MIFRLSLAFPILAAAHSCMAGEPSYKERPWVQDVVYSVLTDRFYDGDPSNNVPAGSDPALFDQSQQDINKYHGGDLRGLEIALQNGYFRDLGVTAIWISPPVRNVWNTAFY